METRGPRPPHEDRYRQKRESEEDASPAESVERFERRGRVAQGDPGLLVAFERQGFDDPAGLWSIELGDVQEWLDSFESIRAKIVESEGVEMLAVADAEERRDSAEGRPGVALTTAARFLANPELAAEAFGPFTLIIRAENAKEIAACAAALEGQLTATLHGTREDLAEHLELVAMLERKAGRIICNGFPTGVEVSHANVARLFTVIRQSFPFGPDDVWTLFHSAAFDFSVWELFGALLYGGRLVVVAHLHDADDGAEALVAHDAHLVADVLAASAVASMAAENPRVREALDARRAESTDTLRGEVQAPANGRTRGRHAVRVIPAPGGRRHGPARSARRLPRRGRAGPEGARRSGSRPPTRR